MKNQEKQKKTEHQLPEYDTGISTNQSVDESVETVLYHYPMWKVNLNFCGYSDEEINNGCDETHTDFGQYRAKNRKKYRESADLVEAALANLTIFEQEFIRRRYFKKMPYKLIAEELAVVERHLYRIRRRVIDQISIAFGWS